MMRSRGTDVTLTVCVLGEKTTKRLIGFESLWRIVIIVAIEVREQFANLDTKTLDLSLG